MVGLNTYTLTNTIKHINCNSVSFDGWFYVLKAIEYKFNDALTLIELSSVKRM